MTRPIRPASSGLAIAHIRRSILLQVTALLLALLSTPASAGTVYVVLASSAVEDGLSLDTEVVVSNATTSAVEVGMHFIPQGTNGAARAPGFTPTTVVVPALETRVFTGITDGAPRGLLEVSSAEHVGISARLVSSRPDGTVNSTSLPVVGSEELIPAGRLHLINGWLRDEAKRTSFGLVNLSRASNTCQVQAFNPTGAALITPTSLMVQPLSLVYFSDAVQAAGSASARDARIQVTCSDDAYSYSVVRDLDSGALRTLWPAADGSSLLRAPGVPLTCEAGSFCLERAGIFLIPSPAEPLVSIDFDAPADSYGSLSIQMTVTHGGWSSIDREGLHSLFWLVPVGADGKTLWLETPAYVNLRGPERNLLVNNSKLDDVRPTADAFLAPGQTFELDFLYDARNRRSRATLLRPDGTVIAEVVHSTDAGVVDTSRIMRLEVGLERGPVEVPTYGWIYQDLVVRLSP